MCGASSHPQAAHRPPNFVLRHVSYTRVVATCDCRFVAMHALTEFLALINVLNITYCCLLSQGVQYSRAVYAPLCFLCASITDFNREISAVSKFLETSLVILLTREA